MNASSLQLDPPGSPAPLALWRIAEAFMHWMFVLFGGPEHIAAQHTLTYDRYKQMLSWVRAGEAMMRQLLLIEAAALPRPNTRPLWRPKRKRVRRPHEFFADKPELWRVSFRAFAERRQRQGARRPSKSKPARGVGREDRWYEEWNFKGQKLEAEWHLTGRRKPPRPRRRGGGDASERRRIPREDRWSSENFKPVSFRSAWPLAERAEALLRVFNNPAPYAARLAHRLRLVPHLIPRRLRAMMRTPADAPDLIGRDGFKRLSEAAIGARLRFESG